ncbi:MAG: PAS domain-containing sensor histidine kinase [Phototrophicaceae bacterium]
MDQSGDDVHNLINDTTSNTKQDKQSLDYAQICDMLPQGIVVQDTDGAIIYSNKSAETILGLTAEKMAGRKSIDPRWHALHADGSPFPGEEHPIMVSLQTGATFDNVIMGIHKPDGFLTWLSVNSRPILDPDSQAIVGAIAIFTDTTHIQLVQEEAAFMERLEKERIKILSDFVRDASHEFRTPLATIHTKLYLMKRHYPQIADSKEITDINRYLDSIDALVNKMQLMVNLNELTKWTISSVTIQPLMDGIVYKYQNSYAGTISVTYSDPDSKIFANEELVIIAISQVLDNAISFSPDEGDILINISDEGHYIQIDIIDHGIGMSAEVLSHVYERFFRVDTARTKRGFGLGLPIVQRIMALHTHQLHITSSPDEGTQVTMKFVNVNAIGQ